VSIGPSLTVPGKEDSNNKYNSIKLDTTAPAAVSTLSGPANINTNVALTWTNVSDAVSGRAYYRVYRSTASGTLGSKISTDGAVLSNSYTDSAAGLSDGSSYYYTVQAVDNARNEQATGNNQVAVKYDITPPPAVNTLVSAANVINTDFLLSWTTSAILFQARHIIEYIVLLHRVS